jgi:hypothetical protein
LTPNQARALEVYAQTGSITATARELGIDRRGMARMLKRAGAHLKPDAHPVLEAPEGYAIKGTSTLVRADGTIAQQWVKTTRDDAARLEAMTKAIAALAEPVRGMASPIVEPVTMADVMAVIPLGDAHVGLLAWAAEGGADWDLRIAEEVLTTAVRRAVSIAPPAGKCLLINLGDYFHTDSQANTTARSGHQLDVDSRWSKILAVGIRIMRAMINDCLQKFGTVTVDNVRGNHDDHSAVMLSHVLSAYYEREPRVFVDMSPALHRYHRHGRCLIGTHHGHTAKPSDLPLLMAAARPTDWGESSHRHIYTGHVHRDRLVEFAGCKVESVNVLAARDAYAAGAGYMSGRELKLDLWHAQKGLRARHIIGIEAP